MNRKQLNLVREYRRYWWAAFSTPVGYVAWTASAACGVAFLIRPWAVLAAVTVGAAALAAVAGLIKAIAVEALMVQLRNGGKPLKSRRHELRRLQIDRASRRDGFAMTARFVGFVTWKSIVS